MAHCGGFKGGLGAGQEEVEQKFQLSLFSESRTAVITLSEFDMIKWMTGL